MSKNWGQHNENKNYWWGKGIKNYQFGIFRYDDSSFELHVYQKGIPLKNFPFSSREVMMKTLSSLNDQNIDFFFQEINYESRLGIESCLPEFLFLLDENKISWFDINKVLNKHIQGLRSRLFLTGEAFTQDESFYSIIRNLSGEYSTEIDYYRSLFSSLNKILSIEEKKTVSSILKAILMNPNMNFRNFIGELSYLNEVLLNGKFTLANVEEVIIESSKRKADFLFKEKISGNKILVEVLNIHLWIKKFKDVSEIINHIDSKIANKIKDKILNKNRKMIIQPVIWIRDYEVLKVLGLHYFKQESRPLNVAKPLCYWSYVDKDNNYLHLFETIDHTAFRNLTYLQNHP